MSGRVWATLGFLLGVLVSIAGNVAHTWHPSAEQLAVAGLSVQQAEQWRPAAGAQLFAAFFPAALLVTVEVLARVSWPSGWAWTLARFGGAGLVALVAAVVSYRHLGGLLAAYGEDRLTSLIGPLAVDGLMVVCGFALLAIGRLRAVEKGVSATVDTLDEKGARIVRPLDELLVAAELGATEGVEKGVSAAVDAFGGLLPFHSLEPIRDEDEKGAQIVSTPGGEETVTLTGSVDRQSSATAALKAVVTADVPAVVFVAPAAVEDAAEEEPVEAEERGEFGREFGRSDGASDAAQPLVTGLASAVKSARSAGLSLQRIADEFGVTKYQVTKILKGAEVAVP